MLESVGVAVATVFPAGAVVAAGVAAVVLGVLVVLGVVAVGAAYPAVVGC
jgi:hypothetical protein